VHAEGIVVEGLLAHTGIVVLLRGLLEGHAGAVVLLQFQIAQAHVEAGVLAQGILVSGHFGQRMGGLGVDTGAIEAHAQLIEGLMLGAGRHLAIVLQGLDAGGILPLIVAGLAQDAFHLGLVGMSRPAAQIILGHLSSLDGLALTQADLAYIIRYQFLVTGHVAEGAEGVEGAAVLGVGVIVVSQVIHGSVGLGNGQCLDVHRLIERHGLGIVALVEEVGGHQGLNAVGMSGIGIAAQEVAPLLHTVLGLEGILAADAGIFAVARHIGGQHLLTQGLQRASAQAEGEPKRFMFHTVPVFSG
jgi:hypothetical protein